MLIKVSPPEGGSVLVDGRRRSYVTLPGHNRGMKPPNAGKQYPAEVLSREEVHQLMAALGRGRSGQRYRAAVALMYRCGLRIAEVLALLPKDIDLAAGTVTVLRGKGAKRRVVGIDPAAAALVEKWLITRRRLGAGPGQPVICLITTGKVGEPVHSSVLREALKDAGARAGIYKRVHPHGLRHAFAAELAREGIPLSLIQRLLGHTSLQTTARYLSSLSPWEAVDAVRGRDWQLPPALGGPLTASDPGGAAVLAA